MSIHTNEPPSSQHPSEGVRNPKAEAKAAKAYAKAVRPWYKKKRVIIPAGLVAVAIAASAGSSGGTGSGVNASSAAASTSEKAAKSAKPDEKVGKVGQAVTNAGTTYKVTSVKTTDTIGDPNLLGARADGTFVVVNLELTNHKDETKTFLESAAKIKTADGKEYETTDKAAMSFGDEGLMLKDIQPELTTRGKLAFELPPSKLSGSTLVVEDLWGSGDIKVDLGL